MTSRDPFRAVAAVALATLLGVAGCERDVDTLVPASFPTDAAVFLDGFGPGVDYQAFGGSKVDALDVDATQAYRGSRSLKVTVPSAGDPSGGFAGGAFVTSIGRDLSGYDALTFWAEASMVATLDLLGLGNDNTGTSRFVAEQLAIPLTTSWRKYIIPIPLAEKLAAEQGLFEFAEGPENGSGYEIWFDEVQFETLGTIANPRPAIMTQTVTQEVGATLNVQETVVTFDVAGVDQTVEASPGYFTFASSDEAVATVAEDGSIVIVGAGSATISAKLGSVAATGEVTVNAFNPPTSPAPAPSVPASDVISLFSNAYTNEIVDTWSAVWDQADVADAQIAGNDVKRYTSLTFAGIEFTSQTIDASAMTHFHMDIWTPDPTAAPAVFRIKLVDFGDSGVFDGGPDDSEHEITLDANSTPPLATGSWVSYDIPLTDFAGLTATAHLAQLIISGDPNTVYVDNVYFHR